MPYERTESLTNQVKQSFASSLTHLQTDYIDSYILHGPWLSQGIIAEDLEIWQAMETLVHKGKVRCLGISNINSLQLGILYDTVAVKPSFVQNRCFTMTQWDKKTRLFCQEHNLIYQGFSLLTANLAFLSHPGIGKLAQKYEKTIAQIIFRFTRQLGMLPLTGTTNPQHMTDDLDIDNFELAPEEILLIENMAVAS